MGNGSEAITDAAAGGSLVETGISISIMLGLLAVTLVLTAILQLFYRHLPDQQALRDGIHKYSLFFSCYGIKDCFLFEIKC